MFIRKKDYNKLIKKLEELNIINKRMDELTEKIDKLKRIVQRSHYNCDNFYIEYDEHNNNIVSPYYLTHNIILYIYTKEKEEYKFELGKFYKEEKIGINNSSLDIKNNIAYFKAYFYGEDSLKCIRTIEYIIDLKNNTCIKVEK